jgi:tripartite-type tricarboxylate transporter receptor subunit TctC
MPELPTLSEQGLTGFEVTSWTGLLAPARTPEPVIRRLYSEVARIANDPDMKTFLANQGAEPSLMDPSQFGAYLKADIAKWGKVVKAAGVKVE